jgi:hypothetical protein
MADAQVTQQAPDTLSAIVDRDGAVKVSFFGFPGFPRVAPPCVATGIGLGVASLLDLAGTKVSVIQVRAEARDYVDIDALMDPGGIELTMALAAAKTIYGTQFNPQITLKALSYFDDGNLRQLPQRLKDRLATAARNVDLDRLPQIAAQPR